MRPTLTADPLYYPECHDGVVFTNLGPLTRAGFPVREPCHRGLRVLFRTGVFCSVSPNRFHSATRSFIKRFVTANLPTGTPPAFAEWSPATKSLYAARIRDVSNALSIAIARSVANALIDGESFLLPRPASLRQPPLTAVVGATADGDDDSDDLGWADVE